MRIVYEVLNETLRELFIGAASLPLDEIQARHRISLPSVISHWDLSTHGIAYREVERNLSETDCKAFLEQYARTLKVGGWKTLLEE